MHYYLKKVLFLWLLGCSMVMYGQNQPPVAMLSADVIIGTAPLTVNFSTMGSHDPDMNVAATIMNYGDGSTDSTTGGTAAAYDHSYTVPGIYTANIIIFDIFGASASTNVMIYVQAPLGVYDLPVKATADADLKYITSTNVTIQNNATIRVENISTLYESFLKFDPSNTNAGNCGTPTGALKLKLTDDSIISNTTDVEVSLSSTNTWNEGNIGLLTDMGTTFTPISSATVPPGDAAIWNLPGVNPSSEFTLKLATLTPSSTMDFASSEHTTDTLRPCLLVEMDNTAGLCQFQVKVKPRIILGGPFKVTVNALMDDDLRVQGLIPMTDPYGFGVTRGANTADNFGDQSIVDWVVVQLRDKTDPTIILKEVPALVRRDGYVVSTENINSDLTIIGMDDDDYYIVIKHRNHLGMMTASPVALNNTPVVIDFTSPSTATYTIAGDPAQKLQTVNAVDYMVMFPGDVKDDTWVRATGLSFMNDFTTLLIYLGRFSVVKPNVYHPADVDLDGTARATGLSFMNDATQILLSIDHFSNIIDEQLP